MRRLAMIAIIVSACAAPSTSVAGSPVPTATASASVPTRTAEPWAGYKTFSGARCEATDPLAPADAVCPARASADIDGDGRVDALIFWGAPKDRSLDGSWHVVITFANGRVITSLIEIAPLLAFPLLPVLAADVNGDGRDELFVETDHGASTAFWSLLVWDGRALVPTTRDGNVVRFAIDGTVTHGSGVQCRTGSDGRRLLVVTGAGVVGLVGSPTIDYDRFNWSEEDLVLRGTTLVFLASRSGVATRDEIEDRNGRFARYWSAACPSAQLTPSRA